MSVTVCVCGAHDSIYFPTSRCLECRAQHKYMYHCTVCMNPMNGECDTCTENDILARVAWGDVPEKEKEKSKEKEKGKEKITRLPDKFNRHGKQRVSRHDKYVSEKCGTSNKKKDRSQLRRIKYGYDEPVDVRIGAGLTVHDPMSESWKAMFGIRALSKLERENALRKAGHRIYTVGCVCLRQAWKQDHPNLFAGTSFREEKCPGCNNSFIQKKLTEQILSHYSDDFAHDDAHGLIW